MSKASIRMIRKPDLSKFRKLDKNIKKAEAIAAEEILAVFKPRVKSRLDDKGAMFKDYKSKRYAHHKMQTGRKHMFEYDGDMLSSLSWRRIKNGIRFSFRGDLQNTKAYVNHHKYGRPFFKFSPSEYFIYRNRVRQAIRKTLKSK